MRRAVAVKTWLIKSTGTYSIQYAEDPGHWHATGQDDKKAALDWAEAHRGDLLRVAGAPLKTFCRGFFDPSGPWVTRMVAKGHTYTDAYLKVRQGQVDNYIIPLFGDIDPRDLTRRYIDDKIMDAARACSIRPGAEDRKISTAPLAGATKNKMVYAFSIILDDLVDQGILEKNPIEGIRPYSDAPVAPRSAIPRDALAKLYPAGHGPLVRVWGSSMWAALFCYLNDTGNRTGEARALKWGELHHSERFIAIRHGIEAGTADKVKGTKTNIVRPAFISERTLQELDIWRSESRHAKDEDFIFTTDGEAPVTANGIIKAFRRGLKAVGIEAENWTPYWLRHSFGTYQMENLTDDEIMLLMGHTNMLTDRMYRHPDDQTVLEQGRAVRDKLDAAREKKA